MKYDIYEDYLKLFPHWLDKNPDSNFSRVMRVLTNQRLDKYHKIKSLDYAKRLNKPIQIHKEQNNPYTYDIIIEVFIDNIKTVNFYINPIINNNEEIIKYEKQFTKEFLDDGTNNHYKNIFHGDTRKSYTNTQTVSFEEQDLDYDEKIGVKYCPLIPNDVFALEVITYDNYRWVKGYPENDNNLLPVTISREQKGYTEHLIFSVPKMNIKKVEILQNDQPYYEKDFYKFIRTEDGAVIHHNYQPQEEDLENNKIIFTSTDKEYIFTKTITSDEKDNNDLLINYYDIIITQYNKNKPYCPDDEKIIRRRYTDGTDCFNHDLSLDMIGHYWHIPRMTYINKDYTSVDETSTEYYNRTIPTYNNRLTENDYMYQERIKRYIREYNKTYFPVLELWKNYGIPSTLHNQKDILSRMDDSYICEKLYYLDNLTIEESANKIIRVSGESNTIKIRDHEWEEAVLVTDLFVVPVTEYFFSITLNTQAPLDLENERLTLHEYYLDRNGNAIKDKATTPTVVRYDDTTDNKYRLDYTITTDNDAVKLDLVLEYDKPFSYEHATLTRRTIKQDVPLYMTTKDMYNSCVYCLQADYEDVPSNINFTNAKAFERLLQRSLPLSHKGFMNIQHNPLEECNINTTISFRLDDYWFEKPVHTGADHYTILCDKLIEQNMTYLLRVTFINESIDTDTTDGISDLYIDTRITFLDSDNNPVTSDDVDERIQCNKKATLTKNLTCPVGASKLQIIFSSTTDFTYKNLRLKRNEDIPLMEIIT